MPGLVTEDMFEGSPFEVQRTLRGGTDRMVAAETVRVRVGEGIGHITMQFDDNEHGEPWGGPLEAGDNIIIPAGASHEVTGDMTLIITPGNE